MSLTSQKAGTKFKSPVQHKGTLTPEEWAVIMLQAGFPADPKVIAEGLGTIWSESSFNASNPGDGVHIGGWAEEPSFGSEAERLDPLASTKAAFKNWSENGKSFYTAWGKWEAEQRPDGRTGASFYKQYEQDAFNGIKKAVESRLGHGIIPEAFNAATGAVSGAVEDTVGAGMSAAEFLKHVGETLLDFRKLGQLAAEGFSWFLRLLLKAIWDYVIAPLVHWGERAVVWYWANFFGTGTEKGSGFGYQLRQNAGIITIGFWSLGYAVLWSNGESLSPVSASESMLGQGVRTVQAQVARRNLIKPSKVKEKTPQKPTPNPSTVHIERVNEFSVSRKRPVRVEDRTQTPNANKEALEDLRKRIREEGSDERSNGRVPRPESSEQRVVEAKTKKIIIPEGVKKPETISRKTQPNSEASQSSGAGVVA